MTSPDSSPGRSPSVLDELYRGRARWDLLTPFPRQDPGDRHAGDTVLDRLAALLRERLDPEEVERTGRLPDGLVGDLRDGGFLALTVTPELGGLGLSDVNAARAVQLAAGRCAALAFTLAVANGFGSASYLPMLPPGPLKDMIAARVKAGLVSGGADAEPIGTANQRRATVATPVDGGAAYLLTGEKIFIGNAPVADLMDVSATVEGTSEVRLFFVDPRSPGFTVTGRHEFMGLRGAEIGALRLDGVRVPAEWLMPEDGDGWRMRPDGPDAEGADLDGGAPDLAGLALLGRHLVIAPTALAIARQCLLWSRDFVNRRTVDGRGLGEYDEIQRIVAATAADVHTIESVAAWPLLGRGRADTRPDLTAAKNLVSRACWRAVDRTMSLLGGEGYETARSKARRQAPPLPVERLFRDARALRVAGGVDFMLDAWSAQAALAAYGDNTPDDLQPRPADGPTDDHRRFVDEQAARLAGTCRRLLAAHPREALFARQRTVRLLGRIAGELLGMTLVLARAASAGTRDDAALADVACAAARIRLAGLWAGLAADEPPRTEVSAGWLRGARFDDLVKGVLL